MFLQADPNISGIFRNSTAVGYQANGVNNGYTLATPAFKNVSGGDYDIQNIKVNGAANDGDVGMQIFNDKGRMENIYFWLNEYYGDDDGWYVDVVGSKIAEKTLKPGEAFYLYAPYAGVTLQSAGEVGKTYTATANNGYTLIGNSFPVAIGPKNIKVNGAANDGDVGMQIFNDKGRMENIYFWLNEYYGDDDGWYVDVVGSKEAEFTLEPGQAIYLYAPYAGVTLNFTNPVQF